MLRLRPDGNRELEQGSRSDARYFIIDPLGHRRLENALITGQNTIELLGEQMPLFTYTLEPGTWVCDYCSGDITLSLHLGVYTAAPAPLPVPCTASYAICMDCYNARIERDGPWPNQACTCSACELGWNALRSPLIEIHVPLDWL